MTCVLAALTAVAACGTSGAAPQTATANVHAYLNCLFTYAKDNGPTGARKACRAQRPADGAGPAVQAFASCLSQHGVVVPSQSPGGSVGDDLLYLNQLRTGTSTQRAAFSACLSTVN